MAATPWTDIPLSEETTYWRSLVRGSFVEVAATALFFYEYFQILPDEVKYIWELKKSIASYLFLVNRYAVLCIRGFRLVQMVSWARRNAHTADVFGCMVLTSIASDSCTVAWRMGDMCTIVMYLVLALFASLRTYAIWEKNRFVLYSITTRTYRAAPPPFTGCDYNTSLNLSIKLDPNMIYMIFEASVVILTWVKTVTLLRRRRQIDGRVNQGMGYVLLRDGTIHFGTLFILNAVGLITFVSTPFDFISSLTDTMISILISRLILNLRQDFLRACNRRGAANTSGPDTAQWTTTSVAGDGRRVGGATDDVSNVTVQFAHDFSGDEGELGETGSGSRDVWEMSESSGTIAGETEYDSRR
ncbi:hypothetical protein BC629DRAFT_1442863 [Irpex lacteus]|nr:hypothetical protein BC629DRAFT_1442863 [Irpex lacteus]